MSHWQIKSTPPHDFFLCLDVDDYFDYEHRVELIAEQGFTRPLNVNGKDFLVTIFFNGDPENPQFDIESSTDLSKAEITETNSILARILGTQVDLKPLMKQAQNDIILAPLLSNYYGFKRISRANLFEDTVNRVIQTQISHKPTAKKMVYGVREGYGTTIPTKDGVIAAWPSPQQLMSADPFNMKKYGLSLRKGEYVVGFANDIVSGEISLDDLENAEPYDFYDKIIKVRGIGPTSAQDLMLVRKSAKGVFPSIKDKNEEKGIRRWILLSYGINPDTASDETFYKTIQSWKDNESLALEFLYLNYILNEKKMRRKK